MWVYIGISYIDVDSNKQHFLIIWVLAAVLHLISGLSLDSMKFFLGGMRIVSTLLQGNNDTESHDFIPKDMRTIISRLHLEPQQTVSACCPRCFQLYDSQKLPNRCTYKKTPTSQPCRRSLKPSSKSIGSRGKLKAASATAPGNFSYQSLEHWIAWMYSRTDIEPWLDRRYSPGSSQDGPVHDMWDSSYLRSFLGPDGKRPFLDPGTSTNEARLIFNLNADGFNPFGNRTAKKVVSVLGIYMVCMNLPPSLRHKPENVFLVGVAPGPKEPSIHQLNHILRPLVDDLERLWNIGLFIKRTQQHPKGRFVRAALVALVCDMPAARLLGGFSHYRSGELPCSMCKHADLDILDESQFFPRTAGEHREMAEAWLHADSEEEQNALFQRNGVRWSELLRLRYWDPVQNTIIDSMHGFYLRIFQRHCRDIWGMDIKFEDCDGLWELKEPTDEQKINAQKVFQYGSRSALKQLSKVSLRYLALQEGIEHRRQKNRLLAALLQVVSSLHSYLWPKLMRPI